MSLGGFMMPFINRGIIIIYKTRFDGKILISNVSFLQANVVVLSIE